MNRMELSSSNNNNEKRNGKKNPRKEWKRNGKVKKWKFDERLEQSKN